MINELLRFSYENKLSHVPSALSMLTYVDTIFTKKFVVPHRDKIVLGKPFGSQAYYLIWNKLGYLDKIDDLSVGVKHEEIDFVDYGEETMGNALGVATGIAIAQPNKLTWVNITDATLQMGSTLEALMYIGHHKLANIVVTVDFNNMQVTGETSNIICVEPIIDLCRQYGWCSILIDGHDPELICSTWNSRTQDRPHIFFYKTVKGYGVPYMEADPVKWHYRQLESI